MAEEEESPGRREAKSEEPPASASPIDSAKQVAEVIQNFGMVLAPSSSFGGIGAQSTVSRDWLIKASGKLTPAEIEMALRHFVPPLAFEEARTALYQDHVVLLGAPSRYFPNARNACSSCRQPACVCSRSANTIRTLDTC
jgi:hypothetical protein